MKQSQPVKHISTSETAQILGISVTSVKNWIRHGFIESVPNDSDPQFLVDDIITLKNRIISGDLKRLKSRANKSNSSKVFLPDELFKSDAEKRAVSEISAYIMRHNINVSTALFLLSLNLLNKSNMLEGNPPEEFLYSSEIVLRKRKCLAGVLQQWRSSLTHPVKPQYTWIMNVNFPDHENIAGIIYQSILMEGDRSRTGMYYTPDSVVAEIVDRVSAPGYLYLDPCCGTGQFLLAFAGKTDRPENIYGIDIDPVAVNVAKINLMMKFPDRDFIPKIFCADSLLDLNESISLDSENRFTEFDCIATNPPWGSHFNKNEIERLKYYYPEIYSGESFSYFIIKSLRMLRNGGVLSFVLPESVLNVKIHRDIREYIIKNFRISRIETKKKIFKNVFSTATVIDIRNKNGSDDIEVVNSRKSFKIRGGRFSNNTDFVYDINIDPVDEKIIGKVYSRPHKTLKGNAEWALGIVTGNNTEYIKDKKNGQNEPLIKGKDILPFKINSPDTFIKFEPGKFQQTADQKFYRCGEKLLYRYISNRLIFACDRGGRLTLNSANILIPRIEGVDMNIIMAFFNSELYQFLFQKKFSSVKVLRSHLEELPVPVIGESEKLSILQMVKEIENGGSPDSLNRFIYGIFGLKKSEADHVRKGIK